MNTEPLQVHSSVTEGEIWTAASLYGHKMKTTTAFLSLTILQFVGCSETTRIATTHARKRK